jgi:predicted small secreted protein
LSPKPIEKKVEKVGKDVVKGAKKVGEAIEEKAEEIGHDIKKGTKKIRKRL